MCSLLLLPPFSVDVIDSMHFTGRESISSRRKAACSSQKRPPLPKLNTDVILGLIHLKAQNKMDNNTKIRMSKEKLAITYLCTFA